MVEGAPTRRSGCKLGEFDELIEALAHIQDHIYMRWHRALAQYPTGGLNQDVASLAGQLGDCWLDIDYFLNQVNN